MAVVKRDLPGTETNSDSQVRAARNVKEVQGKLLINVQPVSHSEIINHSRTADLRSKRAKLSFRSSLCL